MEEKDCVSLISPISPGPYSYESAISGILRSIEEYGVNRVILVYTRRTASAVRGVAKKLQEYLKGCGIDVSTREVCDWLESVGCNTTGELRRIIEEESSICGESRVVVLISPASRRLASATSLASLRQAEKESTAASTTEVEIAHVDFYFGVWSGFPYPYVPRGLEPLIRIHPVGSLRETPTTPPPCISEAQGSLYTGSNEDQCRLPTGRKLPPIACAVAELAKRLNSSPGRFYVEPGRGSTTECKAGEGKPALRVWIHVAEGNSQQLQWSECFTVSNLCSHDSIRASLESALRCIHFNIINAFEKERDADLSKLWQIVMFTGMAFPKIEEPHEIGGITVRGLTLGEAFNSGALSRGRIVIDTNMLYAGIHLEALGNPELARRLAIPSCAVAELADKLSDALKKPASVWSFMDALAFAAIEELRTLGSDIVETIAASKCESSIMGLLGHKAEGLAVATRDRGAHRLWGLYGVIRGIKNPADTLIFLSTPKYNDALRAVRSLDPPNAYMALLSTLVVLKSMEAFLYSLGKRLGKKQHDFRIRVEGVIDHAKIPRIKTITNINV